MKHKPFGEGSGARICEDYGVPNLFQMPIVPELSACGDSGRPLVLVDPAGGGLLFTPKLSLNSSLSSLTTNSLPH